MKASIHLSCLFAILQQCVGATLTTHPNLGTFENPSAYARPRFRYWIPDASVNLSTVRQDIADAGKIGAGKLGLWTVKVEDMLTVIPS